MPRYALRDLVLRMRIAAARSDKKEEAFRVKAGVSIALEAQIYNFGRRPFSGKVTLALPTGWAPPAGIDVKDLAPMGRQVETVRVTPIATSERREVGGVITGAGGARSSPTVMEILVD
jgi:hypothetical protein